MVPMTVTVYSVPGSSPMIVHAVASTPLTLQERPPGAAVAVERQDVPGPAPWVHDCATGALHRTARPRSTGVSTGVPGLTVEVAHMRGPPGADRGDGAVSRQAGLSLLR